MPDEPGFGELFGRLSVRGFKDVVVGTTAGISPVFNGLLRAYDKERARRSTERLMELMVSIQTQLHDYDRPINRDYLESDEFFDVFTMVADKHAQTTNAERRSYYASVAAASVVHGGGADDVARWALHVLDQMSLFSVATFRHVAPVLQTEPRVPEFLEKAQTMLEANSRDTEISAKAALLELEDLGLIRAGLARAPGEELMASGSHDPRATLTVRGNAVFRFLWPNEARDLTTTVTNTS